MNKFLGYALISIGILLIPTAFISMFYMLIAGIHELYFVIKNDLVTFNSLSWIFCLIFLREFVAIFIFLIAFVFLYFGLNFLNKKA